MKSAKNRLHSVMVVGATPAGVAATNKLGELGIPVILVDKDADLNAKLGTEDFRLPSGVPLNFAHRPGLHERLLRPAVEMLGTHTAAEIQQPGERTLLPPHPHQLEEMYDLLTLEEKLRIEIGRAHV